MKQRKNHHRNKKRRHEYPLPGGIGAGQKQQNSLAHRQAEKDISKDAELTAHNRNDDLDEGETARLGEKTGLV